MSTIYIYVGNTAPDVTDTLKQVLSDGSVGPINLTGVTSVHFRMRSQFGTATLIDATATVVDAPNGKVRYDWLLADTTTAINSSPGPYKAWWHLDFAGTLIDTPEFTVMFLTHAPRRQTGPCTDWCSSQDVIACYSDTQPTTCLSSAVAMASEVLYEMSGRQFSGWCQSVIRPCQNFGCWGGGGPLGQQFLDHGHVVWSGSGWRGQDDEPCSCGSWVQKITLPGIAQAVVEVMIGGIIIPASSYRLDPNNDLIRTDGNAWPICQNMMAAGDAPGSFQVTYQHGYAPNEVARQAAAQLAHEFWLACSGQTCALPSGVVEIVRQGIKVTRAASLFKDGATGLAMVDSFLAAFGACEPTYVFSPDTFPTSRRTA